jgi:hypothetical protein
VDTAVFRSVGPSRNGHRFYIWASAQRCPTFNAMMQVGICSARTEVHKAERGARFHWLRLFASLAFLIAASVNLHSAWDLRRTRDHYRELIAWTGQAQDRALKAQTEAFEARDNFYKAKALYEASIKPNNNNVFGIWLEPPTNHSWITRTNQPGLKKTFVLPSESPAKRRNYWIERVCPEPLQGV